MIIPPAEHPSGWLCLVAFIFRRGRSLLILADKVLSGTTGWRISEGKVPRFLYNYTNGAFGANFPQKEKLQ